MVIDAYIKGNKWVFKLNGEEYPLNQLGNQARELGQQGWELVAITDSISADSLT